MSTHSDVELSIVVPMFNEVDNVFPICQAISEALDNIDRTFEIVLVDDGSDDGTFEALRSLVANSANARLLRLGSNFGQTAALAAGIDRARGAIIVTMDADLQNDPRDIPKLLERIEEGYDLVTGWRKDRRDPFLSRELPSRIANWCIARLLAVPVHDTGCGLKAYRAELVRRIPLYSEMHRYLPAMCTLVSSRFAEVVVRHHARRHGKSKYGLTRIWRVLLDVLAIKMLLSCARRPLHWFGGWSLISCLLSVVSGVLCVLSLFCSDRALTMVPPGISFLLLFLGAYLLFAGVLAELVVRTSPKQRVRPMADVKELSRN